MAPMDIARYAAISADFAEGDRTADQIFEARKITAEEWGAAAMEWGKRFGEEGAPLAIAFSEAFAKEQDARHPLPALTVEAYAELVTDIALAGAPGKPLAKRGLRQADYMRLIRHWAKALGGDPTLARRYEAAVDAYEETLRAKAVVTRTGE